MALSISCKSNEEPTVTRTHSNHPPAGNYKDLVDKGTATVTIKDGGCNITGKATYTSISGSTTSKEEKQYDITIIKWYSGDGSTDKGSFLLEGYQGEATINLPATASYFYVNYYPGGISIHFVDQEKTYNADFMTKQP